MQDFAAILRAKLREHVSANGKSQSELAKCGVPQQRISAFLSGGSLRLEHASKLAHLVGMELRARR